jgi:shikimate dehydrogenase
MRVYGLIGYPLGHSFSKGYFAEKFAREHITDARYDNFPLEKIEMLPRLLADNYDIAGLNVTIPYKEQVLSFLNETDPVARSVGAVNTIRVNRIGKKISLAGYNTDTDGFRKSLTSILKGTQPRAIILGTGGSSKAVKYVLDSISIKYLSVSRNPKTLNEIGYTSLSREVMGRHALIINTTPVGMFPETGQCPEIPYEFLGPDHILFDLIYNPDETLFLKKGKIRGCSIKNGLEMLQVQAEKAWEIWNETGII